MSTSINEKIKIIRNATGKNQAAFLEMLGGGMDDSTLSKMENGAEVSYELVLRIVAMFKNSEGYLFGWSNELPDVSVQWSTPEAINAMLDDLEIGNRLRWVAIRCGISAKAMGIVFGCSEGMVNRYWARETMPKFEYVKAFLSVDDYRKYDAFLLGMTDKMPTEPSDGIALRLRRVAGWLKRKEWVELEQLHEYLDANTGVTGLTDGVMKKVLAGVEPLPAAALYNLAITQGKQQAALYILGLSDSIQ
jgi:hypothetical protein